MKNISICIVNYDELLKMVYNEDGLVDKTIFNRIRYFSNDDFSWEQKEKVKPFFSILKENDKIIGIAKCGYFDLSAKSKNDWSISFFSIDKNYRNLGYSHILAEEIFKYAKNNGYEISTSAYTILGKERLNHLFLLYSNKYNVKFYNNDRMHDCESMYSIINGKKLHYSEIN